MGKFNIVTPTGVTLKSDDVAMEFKFNPGFGSRKTAEFQAAQKVVDSEVLRYNSPYVPFDTGKLNQSGISSTALGSGEVAYKTPYARRMYYNPRYNFQGAPMRGSKWFERMKVDHKADILRAAGSEFKK